MLIVLSLIPIGSKYITPTSVEKFANLLHKPVYQ